MTTQIIFIVWRESVEALLVVGILSAWISHDPAYAMGRRFLWGGVLAGLATAGILGALLLEAAHVFSGRGLDIFRTVLVFTAALLIVQMVYWMRVNGRTMRRDLEAGLSDAARSGHWWTVFILALIAVAREGSETVVFLYGMFAAGPAIGFWTVLGGGLAGLAFALLTYGVLQLGGRILSWRLFFRITEILLLLLACALFTTGVGDLVALGVIPYLAPLWDTSALLGDTGPVGGIIASLTGYRAMPDLSTLLTWLVYWGAVVLAWRRVSRPLPVSAPAVSG